MSSNITILLLLKKSEIADDLNLKLETPQERLHDR